MLQSTYTYVSAGIISAESRFAELTLVDGAGYMFLDGFHVPESFNYTRWYRGSARDAVSATSSRAAGNGGVHSRSSIRTLDQTVQVNNKCYLPTGMIGLASLLCQS